MIQLWKTRTDFYAVEVSSADRLQTVRAMGLDASDVPSLLQDGLSHHSLDGLATEGSAEAGEALERLDRDGLIEEKIELT